MKKLHKITVLLIVILSLVFLNLNAGEEKVVDKSFKPCDTVKIKVVSGDCLVRKGNNGEIKVHLTYTYPDDKYTPIFKVEGETLILKEEFAQEGNVKGKSSWTVTLPEKTDIEAKTASGSFSAGGLTGDITVKVASGNINIGEFKGKLTARTASGDIRLKDCAGNMEVDTASGDILAENCTGGFDSKCASGDIKLTGIVFTGESSLKSVSGDVEVKLAKTVQQNLDLSTVSGDISLDYNGNAIIGHFIFSGKKNNMESCIPFENNDESGCSPFSKRYFTSGGSSPEVTLKTISGHLSLKK